jgi:hypothetical protein
MSLKNHTIMKTENIFYRLKFFLLPLALGFAGVACNPVEDDSYSLGGNTAALPADWTVSVTDKNNEVTVVYAPFGDFIDGANVLAVQFDCPEAGISFVVKKDDPVEPKTAKVYKSGAYTLYAAAITRTGAGEPKAFPFSVEKDLTLSTLSEATLKESKAIGGKDFRYTEFYIEKSSFITLAGELANADVTLNLDFFKRISETQAQFLGESNVYTIYYNAEKKIVLLGVPAPDYPDYLIALGKGFGYPSKVDNEPFYIGGYPQQGMAENILEYTLFRKIGEKTFQTTVMVRTSDVEFKPFHAAGGGRTTNNWGNGGEYKYNVCTFSGAPLIFKDGGGDNSNWIAGDRVDPAQPYRITVTITNDASAKAASVNIQPVDFNGEPVEIVEPEPDPVAPPGEDTQTTINFAAITGEGPADGITTLSKELEKDFEYTLVGSIEQAAALLNVDFFERTALDKAKFLGETGTYTLYYDKNRKNLLLTPADVSFPGYIVATGKGFGYPVAAGTPSYIGNYPDDAGVADVLRYVLFRKTGDATYQATIQMKTADVEFKPYHANSATMVINDWAGGGEYNYDKCAFSGELDIFQDGGGGYHNWVAGTNADVSKKVRITVTVTGNNPRTADVEVSVVQ